MATFYKIAIKARAVGQEVVNVLYYGDQVTGDVPTTPSIREGFLGIVVAWWQTTALPLLPNTYILESATGTIVNEVGETVSDFPVEAVATGFGTNGSTTDTPGICAIIGFRTSSRNVFDTPRTPKRSYIALGPIDTTDIDSSGLIAYPGAATTTFLAAIQAPRTFDTTTLDAVRVGVANASGVGSAGVITSALARPYASFRRSRMFRPSGI